MLPIAPQPSGIARRHLPTALLGCLMALPALSVEPPPAALAAQTGAPVAAAPAAQTFTDRVIVKYRSTRNATAIDSATLARAQVAGNRAGVRLSPHRARGGGSHVLRLDRRLSSVEARNLADAIRAGDADVEYAEPDQILQIQWLPNDPSFGSQWHYHEATAGLNLPAAWDQSRGSGVTVAVIDTGYRPHADLAANLVAGYDFIADSFVANDGGGRDADAQDPGDWVAANECGGTHSARASSWHGTHVAGTIAAATNNGNGVAGVAPDAKVMPVRVLGKCGGYTSDIADAIVWASGGSVAGVPNTATPARVLNLSLGGGGSCSTTTQNAIAGARSRGTVVVVAAGNSNTDAGGFTPANCAGVVTVASVGRSGARAYYSNTGSVVDVAAPGGDLSAGSSGGVLSTLNSGSSAPGSDNYAWYQGTSMAAPHVAGTVALMLAKNPALTPDQVEAALKSSARAFPAACSGCGSGLVDARAAVDAAGGTAPPPPPPPPPVTPTAVAEVENNNTLARAQPIGPNPALVNATIGARSDTDYFRVTLGAGRTLAATLTPPASADYDLYAYNASGVQIASSRLLTGQVDSVSVTHSGSSATTVYLRVVYFSGGTGSRSGRYTLGLSQ